MRGESLSPPGSGARPRRSREALRIARQISYPTLTWQAAHLLAQPQAGQNNLEEAFATIQLAVETIDAVATRIPDPALRRPSSPGRVCKPYARSKTVSAVSREGL